MKITINSVQTEVLAHETLLEACRRNRVDVPSLCHAEGAVSVRQMVTHISVKRREKIVGPL